MIRGFGLGRVITLESLPAHLIKRQDNNALALATLAEVSSEAKKMHIAKILKLNKGSKTKTAQLLGISRKTLWGKRKLFDIENKKDSSGSS